MSRNNRKTQLNWEKNLFLPDTLVSKYLRQHSDPEKFECLICLKKNTAYSSGLIKNIPTHVDSDKHKRAFDYNALNDTLIQAINIIKYGTQSDTEIESREDTHHQLSESVETLQFELAQFLIENRLSFKVVERLVPLLQKTLSKYHPKAINECDMSRKTLTKLVSYCICGSIKQEIVEDLINSPYSLAVDETTDAFGCSYLAVCAKYLPPSSEFSVSLRSPVTKLISIIKLKDSKTALDIYTKLKEEIFFQHPKLMKNIMGLVMDQGSNMIGKHKGLGALMQKDVPHLVTFHDLSHAFNLICQKSIQAYPPNVISCVKDICSYFGHSSFRMEKLKMIQIDYDIDQALSILSFVSTRWLSLLDSTNRILMLWEPLKEYFQDEDEDWEAYFTPKSELYLQTLAIILEKLCYYNRLFQQDLLFYDRVHELLIESFKIFARVILSPTRFPVINFGQVIEIDYNARAEDLVDILISDDNLRMARNPSSPPECHV